MNAERSVNIITCTVVKPAEQNCKNFLEAYHIFRRQSSIFRTHTMCRTHTHAHTYSTMGPSKSPQILTRSPNSLNTYKFRDQNQEWRGNRRGSIWPKYMGQTLWEPIICKFNKFFDNHIDKKCSMRKNHALILSTFHRIFCTWLMKHFMRKNHTHVCKFHSDSFKIRLIKCSMMRKNQALMYTHFTETYLSQKYCQVLNHRDQSSTHICRTI